MAAQLNKWGCPHCGTWNGQRAWCMACAEKRGSPEYNRAKEKLTLWGLPFKEMGKEVLWVKIGKWEYSYIPAPGKWWVLGDDRMHTKSFFKMAWAVMPEEQKVALTLMDIDPAVNNGWGAA